MSRTELEEVQALLERVLPDPSGFAGRLLKQAMGQWGPVAAPTATAFYSATTAEEFTASETVMEPEQPTADERPTDINILLAAALGACECWGLQADCRLCRGLGSAGWIQPEPELFDEFVRPAVARLPGIYIDAHVSDASVTADEGNDNHQPEQEVDA
jgi:hypothetical protein